MSVDFDDPLGWGYCEYCAFEVAVDPETGRMLAHERRNGGWDFVRCYGSLLDPTEQPAPEAKPKTWQEAVVEALSENSNVTLEEVVTGGEPGEPLEE
jgi:hypothetical protein